MDDFPVGVRVCVVGRDTDNMLHQHSVVARLTKTMIVLKNGRRYHRDERLHPSIPYSAYGGTKISRRCQRPLRASTTSWRA
jgi:hypothetical protein